MQHFVLFIKEGTSWKLSKCFQTHTAHEDQETLSMISFHRPRISIIFNKRKQDLPEKPFQMYL